MQSPALDESGMVLDFGVLKQELARVCDGFDHVLLNDVPPFDHLRAGQPQEALKAAPNVGFLQGIPSHADLLCRFRGHSWHCLLQLRGLLPEHGSAVFQNNYA